MEVSMQAIKTLTILFFVCLVFMGLGKAEWVFWSNETKEFFAGESKLVIDHNAYVSDYDLEQGWIKIYTNLTEVVSICDPFSGKWIRKTIKRGETNITLPFKPKPYAGLRLVVVSSPFGFASVKEKSDAWAWYDYPIVILRSEMAKWSWERTAYALGLFIFGLALSRHMKKDRLIVNRVKHLIIIVFVVIVVFAILSMKYETTTVKLNETVKQIPHLIFDTYYIKEWYNYVFALCFVFGYVFGLLLWSVNNLHVAYVGYNQPLRLCIYPYDPDRGVIRDFDDELTVIKFKNSFKQFINFELNGYSVSGILATSFEDFIEKSESGRAKVNHAIAAFFGFMAICIIGDYLNVFRIDLPYSLLFSVMVALAANTETVKQWLGINIRKIKVIECSELMNEDNYTKMLKEAEIKHVIEDYEKLLRDYVKEKITMPRRAVKQLLSMIKQVKVTKVEEKYNRREKHVEDKD